MTSRNSPRKKLTSIKYVTQSQFFISRAASNFKSIHSVLPEKKKTHSRKVLTQFSDTEQMHRLDIKYIQAFPCEVVKFTDGKEFLSPFSTFGSSRIETKKKIQFPFHVRIFFFSWTFALQDSFIVFAVLFTRHFLVSLLISSSPAVQCAAPTTAADFDPSKSSRLALPLVSL